MNSHLSFSSTMIPSGGSPSFSIAHGISCASCNGVGSGSGSTVNTAGRSETSATAAAKIVVSIKRGYESIRIFELGMM
jgi:hypothetical protein